MTACSADICSFAATLRYPPFYPQRCGKALDEALYSTPAYAAWRPLDPGLAAPAFARLAAMPALTKASLRACGHERFVPRERSIAEGLAAGTIGLVDTSGTTDDQVTNVWYQPWWDASEAASWQLNAHARAAADGGQREAILTSPFCTGRPCEDGYLTMQERTLGRFLYLNERSDPTTWTGAHMDRMVAELNAFEPVVLEANPSFLARLSRHIVRSRLRVHSPALIELTYENPSLLHYRQIAHAFAAPIASSYGSTEAGYVFMECEAGRLHQVVASCHVDFIPLKTAHGGPQLGRILVTTFDNPWRSLLRFDIGDIVRLDADGPCPCGRQEGLTLSSIEGRAAHLTLRPEGRVVTQGAVDRILAEVAGLDEYQLVQTGGSAYLLRFVAETAEPHQVARAACAALQALYGPQASITAQLAVAIAPAPPGKYRLTVPLTPVDVRALQDERYAPADNPLGGDLPA